MSGHWATVSITDAVPPSERIARQDLAVGDVVFDVWGRRYAVIKVHHYAYTTKAVREDGAIFTLYGDQDITVIRGGAE